MSYVLGEDRGQAALLPVAIEDYVAADAPVRVIDAFVNGLDVNGLGFGRSVPAATGRPPYGAALVGACRAFVMLCRDAGLFTARLIALDGSKFCAVASGKKIMGRREIAEEARPGFLFAG
jgi:transposase